MPARFDRAKLRGGFIQRFGKNPLVDSAAIPRPELLDPGKVLQLETGRKLMALGMLNGGGLANRRKFSQYFKDASNDHVKARGMVSGSGNTASIAGHFEGILLAATS